MTVLVLPPVFTPVVTGASVSVLERARRLAQDGAAAGTFVWADRDDRLECAIVLHPERTLAESRMAVLVAALALDHAVGAVAPPGLESSLEWPGTVRINGGRAGAVELLVPADCRERALPSWLVVHGCLRIVPTAGVEAGDNTAETCLREEGCADATAMDLAQGFARALLHWMDRWLEDGRETVSRHWLHRASRHGTETALMIGGRLVAGTLVGLDESGDLILDTRQGRLVVALRDAAGAAWPLE